ncbi:CHRD domain-containing protein [Oceanobacillus salinisoli]|uniref:CHRD domain-containing protein n=1 Tax=Oceanobacillus salinisoli TaxID=2678611 RepID=UPI0012E16C29|nr:CHRD domain-containing protein [Oceanobacillus salinisoli]
MYYEHFYMAELTGSKEVPPVHTNADGVALFYVDEKKDNIRYRLNVNNLTSIEQVNIHLGRRNITGPDVALLYESGNRNSSYDNGIIEGFITAKDLIGPLTGKPLSSLINDLRAGKVFVNVKSLKYPNGELRGKIVQNG